MTKEEERLLSLQEQFCFLCGFVDGLTYNVKGDTLRDEGVSDLRGVLHSLPYYRELRGEKSND